MIKNGQEVHQKDIVLFKKILNNIHIEMMHGLKIKDKNQIKFNGPEMLQKNMLLLNKILNSIHIEMMHGLKINGKNLIISNG